ncbi:hypothetical protein ACFSSC_11820 [Corynebacterium mendelii]|uniref:Or membrane protein n=1 Tax=Corynebacterium mendelii TaxID=2765362 RepID=A0A939E2I0_9CORY|nr:hypothetical protein [Corynebacterium mendelii]MBN9645311.1 hypothetical protein [Corynebacterium mendelii]
MRSIRRAAIAGATAATLILGAANVATANENTTDKDSNKSTSSVSKDLKYIVNPPKEMKNGEKREGGAKNLSARIGSVLEADQPANGARLFGSTQDYKQEPKWAKAMLAVTYIGAIGSILGLVVFPAYNFLLANGMLPWSPR